MTPLEKSNKTLIYVLVGLTIFAIGYIGMSLYQQHQREEAASSGTPPSIPAVPDLEKDNG